MPLVISCNDISLSHNLFQLKTKVESLKSCTPLLKINMFVGIPKHEVPYHPPNLCKHSVMDEVDLEAICLQGRFPLGETVDPCDWEMTDGEMALPWSLARRPDA